MCTLRCSAEGFFRRARAFHFWRLFQKIEKVVIRSELRVLVLRRRCDDLPCLLMINPHSYVCCFIAAVPLVSIISHPSFSLRFSISTLLFCVALRCMKQVAVRCIILSYPACLQEFYKTSNNQTRVLRGYLAVRAANTVTRWLCLSISRWASSEMDARFFCKLVCIDAVAN